MSYNKPRWISREGSHSRNGKTFFGSQYDLPAPDLDGAWRISGFFVDAEFSGEYPDEKAVPSLVNTLSDKAAATARRVYIASMNKFTRPRCHPARPQSLYEKFVQPGGEWGEKPYLFDTLEEAKKAVLTCWTIESLAAMTEAKALFDEAAEDRQHLIEELLSERAA
jgi:hypothetical protein